MLKYFRKHSALTRVLIPLFLIAWLVLPAAIACEAVFKQLHGAFLSECDRGDAAAPSHHEPALPDDCGLGLCLDAKTLDQGSHGLFDQKPEILLIWAVCWLVLLVAPGPAVRAQPFPPRFQRRRRVPLIYRFCTLLN